jgi:hypothetical protein
MVRFYPSSDNILQNRVTLQANYIVKVKSRLLRRGPLPRFG